MKKQTNLNSLEMVRLSIIGFNGVSLGKRQSTVSSFIAEWKASKYRKHQYQAVAIFNHNSVELTALVDHLLENRTRKEIQNRSEPVLDDPQQQFASFARFF